MIRALTEDAMEEGLAFKTGAAIQGADGSCYSPGMSCRTTLAVTLIVAMAAIAGCGSNDCVAEGQQIGAKVVGAPTTCCEGLAPIPVRVPADNGTCSVAPPDVQVCTRCGDGVCGSGENRCNCPGDCK
jgi:hypothetical protein